MNFVPVDHVICFHVRSLCRFSSVVNTILISLIVIRNDNLVHKRFHLFFFSDHKNTAGFLPLKGSSSRTTKVKLTKKMREDAECWSSEEKNMFTVLIRTFPFQFCSISKCINTRTCKEVLLYT